MSMSASFSVLISLIYVLTESLVKSKAPLPFVILSGSMKSNSHRVSISIPRGLVSIRGYPLILWSIV